VFINAEDRTVEAIPDRQGMFTANVVTFLNQSALNLAIKLNEIVPGTDFLDIDIDVTLKHPFPGMDQFDGYDVRGVFMGDGSESLASNSDLVYPAFGVDQFMLADPVGGNGAPDGYTRWFNISEFTTGGMPLVSYTQGKYASAGFNGTATICPYRYFADGLGKNEDLWTSLNAHPGSNGVFSAGVSNTRNYYLRFPDGKGVKYGYAVLANWEGPTVHPSNTPETVACMVSDNSDVYYIDPAQKGGDLDLDISVWDWGVESAGVGDYGIIIESTVLSSPHPLDSSEMTPVGGDENYSTYHVEIPADNVTGNGDQEYWVMVEYENYDYTNDFGVVNDAWEDALTAVFRFNLDVPNEIECNDWVPVVDTLNGKTSSYAAAKPHTGWTVEGDLFEDGNPGVAVSDGSSDVAVAANVLWVDINTISFDIDLSDVPAGTYDIVVTNGCGAQEEGVGEDLLTVLNWIHVVDDPNIDVVTGYDGPTDITVDPSSDQVGISYANYWVKWSNDYSTHSGKYNSWYNSWLPGYPDMWYWDSQPGLIYYAHDASPWYPGKNLCWSWCDWTGWQSTHSQWQPDPNNRMTDISNVQGTDELWGLFHWASASADVYKSPFIYTSADYSIGYWYNSASWYNTTGDNGVVLDNVRAIDLGVFSNPNYDVFILEYLPGQDTGVIEKWRKTLPKGSMAITLMASFGEGHLYNPLDITCDSNSNVFVLETDSNGDPNIWAYDDAGELIGWSEVLTSDEMSGDALRMDASLSAAPDEVHVLHTGGVTRFAM
jgi:hypothetical protein